MHIQWQSRGQDTGIIVKIRTAWKQYLNIIHVNMLIHLIQSNFHKILGKVPKGLQMTYIGPI